MADDWKKQWQKSGYYFSDEDMKRAEENEAFRDKIFQAKEMYANGDTEGGHALAEDARRVYNYSGGAAGNEYKPTGTGTQTGSYGTGTNRPSFDQTGGITRALNASAQAVQGYGKYVDPYAGEIATLKGQIMNRAPFSYDYETDPAYQAYKKEYTRMGQRAMDDTLAKVSARTGGLASSYAATAGNQAYGNYMAQLSDKIPELYKLAYSMYADEGDQLLQRMNLLRGLSGDAYGRYGDDYNRMMDQYGIMRQLYGDAVDMWRYGVGDWEKDRAYADEREQNEYNRKWDEAITAAKYGDYSLLAALGIDTSGMTAGKGGSGGGNYTLKGDDVTLPPVGSKIDLSTDVGKKVAAIPGAISNYLSRWDDMDAETRYIALVTSGVDTSDALRISSSGDRWQAQMALENAAGTGEEAGDMYSQLFAAGATTEEEAKRLLQQNGMKYSEANDAAKTYMGLYGNGTFGNTVGGDTMMTAISGISGEKDAVNMLEENGIMAKPLTREQWALDSGNSILKTYTDYLKAFVYEYMNGG